MVKKWTVSERREVALGCLWRSDGGDFKTECASYPSSLVGYWPISKKDAVSAAWSLLTIRYRVSHGFLRAENLKRAIGDVVLRTCLHSEPLAITDCRTNNTAELDYTRARKRYCPHLL